MSRRVSSNTAGAALVAGRAVGDRLAAAEAAMGQEVVEVAGLVADQMREHLALMPARQIGAGRGRRQVKLGGITRMLGHDRSEGLRKQPDRASRRGGRRSIGLDSMTLKSEKTALPKRHARKNIRHHGPIDEAGPRSGSIAACWRYLGVDRTVDDDGSQDDVVQQPPAAVEQADQEHQGRQE